MATLSVAGLSGCAERVASLHLETSHCPSVSVVAAGRVMNFYEVLLDIQGQSSVMLMSNIDVPGDESQHVLALEPTQDGISVQISDSEQVRDIDLQLAPQCRIITVRPNKSFKPNPLRGSA